MNKSSNFKLKKGFILTCLFLLLGLSHSPATEQGIIRIACDGAYNLFVNGTLIVSGEHPSLVREYSLPLALLDSIAIEVERNGRSGRTAVQIEAGSNALVSNLLWQASNSYSNNWQSADFDHSTWPGATETLHNGKVPASLFSSFDPRTKWIIPAQATAANRFYLWTRFNPNANALITITSDKEYKLYKNGGLLVTGKYPQVRFLKTSLTPGDLIAIQAKSTNKSRGSIAEVKWLENQETKYVLVTDASWKHSTASVSNWTQKDFNDTSWKSTKVLGSRGISPWKSTGGLTYVSKSAKWIWNNPKKPASQIYLRKTIPNASLAITADDKFWLYQNGKLMGSGTTAAIPQILGLNLRPGDVLAIKVENKKDFAGLLASLSYGNSQILSNSTWKYTRQVFKNLSWTQKGFSDSSWLNARTLGSNGMNPHGTLSPVHQTAKWIWSMSTKESPLYFRFVIGSDNDATGITTLQFTAANQVKLYHNGAPKKLINGSNWKKLDTVILKLKPGDVISIEASHSGTSKAGFLLKASGAYNFVSDANWKVTSSAQSGWAASSLDDTTWNYATSYGPYGSSPWGQNVAGFKDTTAHWIWSNLNDPSTQNLDHKVYFRRTITGLTSKVVNARSGAPAVYRALNFNGREGAGKLCSQQAIQISFDAGNLGNQAINIHTENPDGREGMIGVEDPTISVPLYWAAYDEPDYTFPDHNHDNANNETPVPDVSSPHVFALGNILSDMHGKRAILANPEVAPSDLPEVTDGQIWIYLCADYTGAPAQQYRTAKLVVELITLP